MNYTIKQREAADGVVWDVQTIDSETGETITVCTTSPLNLYDEMTARMIADALELYDELMKPLKVFGCINEILEDKP